MGQVHHDYVANGAPIGIKAAFGLGLHNKLLSYDVYDHFRKAYALELVSRSAYAVTFLMLVISATGFLLIRSYVSLRQYAMLDKGGRWAPGSSRRRAGRGSSYHSGSF